MRRRHRLIIGASLTLATMVLAGCGDPDRPPTEQPPAARTVLDTRIPGWETSAWLADDDQLCIRAARTREQWKRGQDNEYVSCEPAPSALQAAGPPLLPTKPVPYIAPMDPRSEEIMLVGTVRGAASTVSVTMFGHTATGLVRALPASPGQRIGVYAVWLPRSGRDAEGMDLTDITAVEARDTAGHVISRIDS